MLAIRSLKISSCVAVQRDAVCPTESRRHKLHDWQVGGRGRGAQLNPNGGGGVGWGSLAPRTTPGSTKARIVTGVAGGLTFKNWTSPLTGSPSGNSASGAGSSAGCRNQEEQREKRGCEYRSHIVFR